jgi:GNAT superfamily N-acetyltransferase
MKIEFVSTEELSDNQKAAIAKLRGTVYPPEVIATLPDRFFSWAAPQWSVFLWEDDEIISRVGMFVRRIVSNGEEKTIGGVGGVMTHPSREGKGYASQAMREASRRFEADLKVSYALLFCHPHLVAFYKRLGWKPFEGKLLVEQPGGKVEFSVHGPMVLDIKEPAPFGGSLDLNGLPW